MIILKREEKPALYQQLYTELKKEILDGRYKKKMLPAIRVLAKELGVSINTVNQAYAQLSAEGYIYSRPGSGYYANKIDTLLIDPKPPAPSSRQPARPVPENPDTAIPVRHDLRYGNLNAHSFPWKQWAECMEFALCRERNQKMICYGEGQGESELRRELAEILYRTRGVHCTPEQIVICAGLQNVLSLLTELLPPEKFRVGFEEPGYNKSRDLFLRQGYTLSPIAVDENGISISQLQKSRCNLLYLTPSHQFPIGHVLPISQRIQVLNYMYPIDGYIIEDDYDSEFRYKSAPIPSLQSLDQADQVIYTGTFSKCFTPNVRVAYVVLPRKLLPVYQEKMKDRRSWVPKMMQYALAEFLKRGYYERHVRKVVRDCEKKYMTVVSLFENHAPKGLRLMANNSGLHLMFELDTDLSESCLLEHFRQCGILLTPTNQYWLCPDSRHLPALQIGFVALEIEELKEAVLHLFHSFALLEK